MPRLKYTTTDQRLASSRASRERDQQRRTLLRSCNELVKQKPDVLAFVEGFWQTRILYLEMERHLEKLLWDEGILKRPLLLDSSLTDLGRNKTNGQAIEESNTTEEAADSPALSDSGV